MLVYKRVAENIIELLLEDFPESHVWLPESPCERSWCEMGMVDPGVIDFPAGRIDGMFMQSGNPLVDS